MIVLVLSLTITMMATAAYKDGIVMEVDHHSCGKWIEDRKNLAGSTAQAWISGYLTAYNRQTPGVMSILGNTNMASIYLWMDKYCQENPLDLLNAGLIILTNELWPNRKH